MDAAIGSVLGLLDEYELADNTIVIFFSDNGGTGTSDNGPLRGTKGNTFEGGIRVCATVRYPARLPAGRVCDEFLTSLDVFPTLLNLADVPPPEGVILDGFDMLPTLAGDRPSPRREMFWKRREHEAARIDQWKWVHNRNGTFLFDLSQDLAEQRDLTSDQPEKATEMEGRFNAWLAEMDAAEPRGPFKDY
jgi:arylsulfatase A-like enzyme